MASVDFAVELMRRRGSRYLGTGIERTPACFEISEGDLEERSS